MSYGPTIDVRCSQCGAEPGKPCTYVSGDGTPEEAPGTERTDLHFYRTRLPKADDPADVVVRLRALAECVADIKDELETAGFRTAAGEVDDALDDIDSAIQTLEDDNPSDQEMSL